MPDQDSGTTAQDQDQPTKPEAGGGGEDFKAMLERERAERTALAKQHEELTAAFRRRGHENLQLQKELQRRGRAQQRRPAPQRQSAWDEGEIPLYDDDGNGDEPQGRAYQQVAPEPGYSPTRQDRIEQQLAITSFKLDVPDWRTVLPEVRKILNDEVLLEEVGTFRRDGTINWEASMKNAYREIISQRYHANQAEAAKAKADLDAKRAEENRRAVISGGGAYETDPDLVNQDRSEWTPEDYVKKGLVAFDPNDPSRLRGRSGKKRGRRLTG